MASPKSALEVFTGSRSIRRHLPHKHNAAAYTAAKWYPATEDEILTALVIVEAATEFVITRKTEEDKINLETAFESLFCDAIHGSNSIDDVGPSDSKETAEMVKSYLSGLDGRFDLQSLSQIPLEGGDRKKREVVQHVQAFLFCRQSINENLSHGKDPITEESLLRAHKILTHGIPAEDGNNAYQGEYRQKAVHVGPSTPSDEHTLLHQPPAASEIPESMQQWVADYNAAFSPAFASNNDILLEAAELKLRFICRHPFLHGNERLSRVLFNAMLSWHLPGCMVPFGSTGSMMKRNYMAAVKDSIYGDGDGTPARNAGHMAFYCLRGCAAAAAGLVGGLGEEGRKLGEELNKFIWNYP